MRDHDAMLAEIGRRATMPHDWQRNCCVRYAAAVVGVTTGRRGLLKGLRWRTARGALRVLQRLGGMQAAVSSVLRPIAPASARRGDVAGVPDDALGLRLMIVEGETLVGPGDQGEVRQRRAAMTHAWSAD